LINNYILQNTNVRFL